MRGKVVAITGANTGIGRAAAVQLARYGASVLLLCRSRERTEDALTEARAASEAASSSSSSSAASPVIEFVPCDLSTVASTRAAADALARTLGGRQLDVLLHNAALMAMSLAVNDDGHPSMFATNHLGPFVLTHECLARRLLVSSARIVLVSSVGHMAGPLDLDDIEDARPSNYTSWVTAMRAYGRTKLLNLMFTRVLAALLPLRDETRGMTVNELHPGAVRTELYRDTSGVVGFVFERMLATLFKTSVEGAQTLVHLASSPAVAGVTGRYYINNALASTMARGRQLNKRDLLVHVWRYSMKAMAGGDEAAARRTAFGGLFSDSDLDKLGDFAEPM